METKKNKSGFFYDEYLNSKNAPRKDYHKSFQFFDSLSSNKKNYWPKCVTQ